MSYRVVKPPSTAELLEAFEGPLSKAMRDATAANPTAKRGRSQRQARPAPGRNERKFEEPEPEPKDKPRGMWEHNPPEEPTL